MKWNLSEREFLVTDRLCHRQHNEPQRQTGRSTVGVSGSNEPWVASTAVYWCKVVAATRSVKQVSVLCISTNVLETTAIFSHVFCVKFRLCQMYTIYNFETIGNILKYIRNLRSRGSNTLYVNTFFRRFEGLRPQFVQPFDITDIFLSFQAL